MAMIRMNIHVDEDVPAMLAELAGSNKKMGQYLSSLIRQVHASQIEVGKPGDVEVLSNAVANLSLRMNEAEAAIARLTQEVRR